MRARSEQMCQVILGERGFNSATDASPHPRPPPAPLPQGERGESLVRLHVAASATVADPLLQGRTAKRWVRLLAAELKKAIFRSGPRRLEVEDLARLDGTRR